DHARLLVQRSGESARPGTTVEIRLVAFDDLIRRRLGLAVAELPSSESSRSGLQITEIEKGSPAERARLQTGFLLAGIDGQSTPDLMTAGTILTGKKPGERAQLAIVVPQRLRNGFMQYREAQVDLETGL